MTEYYKPAHFGPQGPLIFQVFWASTNGMMDALSESLEDHP